MIIPRHHFSSDIGTGLALNYWLGFLKFKTMPESGGAGGDTILDELKNFQLSSGLTILVQNIFTCREAARSCRSVGRKKNKKRLMDFETLKPLFLVLFGIILSSFEPV